MTDTRKLHQEGLQLAKNFLHDEQLLLALIIKIDTLKGWRELGYSSLHDYLVNAYQLSEDQAERSVKLTSLPQMTRLEEEDPFVDADRALPAPVKRRLTPAAQPRNLDKRYIPARIRNAVLRRDRNQCTHVYPDGNRCDQRLWVGVHHIRPSARRGKLTLDNLTTKCYAHHRGIHEFGEFLLSLGEGPG